MSFSQTFWILCCMVVTTTYALDQPQETVKKSAPQKPEDKNKKKGDTWGKGGQKVQKLSDSDEPVMWQEGGADRYDRSQFAFADSCSGARPLVITLYSDHDHKGPYDCRAFLAHMIDHANDKIYLFAYSFTCPTLMDALGRASARGVKVCLLLDRSSENNPQVRMLLNGCPTIEALIDDNVRIAHNKVIVIINTPGPDSAFDHALITGSYNFTYSAQFNNAENIACLINCRPMAESYLREWLYRSKLEKTRKPIVAQSKL